MSPIELRLIRHLKACLDLRACDVITGLGQDLLLDALIGPASAPLSENTNALCLYERDDESIQKYQQQGGIWSQIPFSESFNQDEHHSVLTPSTYDLIVSNLAIDWLDAGAFIAQLQSLLSPEGEFRFTSLGSATAVNSRSLLSELDPYPHFNEFYEMQDIGDALLGAGFKDVSLLTHRYTLEYGNVDVLLADAYRLFGVNSHPKRRRNLGGRKVLQAFKAAVTAQINEQGLFREQIEIVVAYGKKAAIPVMGGEIPVRVGS